MLTNIYIKISNSFEQAVTNPTEWGRQVESAVGAFLAGRSVSYIQDRSQPL